MRSDIIENCKIQAKEILAFKMAPHQLGVAISDLLKEFNRLGFGKWIHNISTIFDGFWESNFRVLATNYPYALNLLYKEKANTKRKIALEKAGKVLSEMLPSYDNSRRFNYLERVINSRNVSTISSKFLKIKYKMFLGKLLFAYSPLQGTKVLDELYKTEIQKYSQSLEKLNLYLDYFIFSYFTTNKIYKSVMDAIDSLVKKLSKNKKNLESLNLFNLLYAPLKEINTSDSTSLADTKKRIMHRLSNKLQSIDFINISTFGEYLAAQGIDIISLFYKLFKELHAHPKLFYDDLASAYMSSLMSYLLVYDYELNHIFLDTMEYLRQESELSDILSRMSHSNCEEIVYVILRNILSGKYEAPISDHVKAVLNVDYLFIEKGFFGVALKLINTMKQTRKADLSLVEKLSEIPSIDLITKKAQKKEKQQTTRIKIKKRRAETERAKLLEELTLKSPTEEVQSHESHETTGDSLSKENMSPGLPLLEGYSLTRIILDNGVIAHSIVRDKNENYFLLVKILKNRVDSGTISRVRKVLKKWEAKDITGLAKLIKFNEDNSVLYYLTEYSYDYLEYLITTETKASVDKAIDIFLEIVKYVDIFHKSWEGPHANIKPYNIFHKNDRWILTNPELNYMNLILGVDKDKNTRELQFTSPEQFNHSIGAVNEATDVWQLGVLFYVMLTGDFYPWGITIHEIEENILSGKLKQNSNISQEIKPLISKMTKVNPADRLPLKSVIHELFLL